MIRMIEKMRISPPIVLQREVRFSGAELAQQCSAVRGTATCRRDKDAPHTEVTAEGDARSRGPATTASCGASGSK